MCVVCMCVLYRGACWACLSEVCVSCALIVLGVCLCVSHMYMCVLCVPVYMCVLCVLCVLCVTCVPVCPECSY